MIADFANLSVPGPTTTKLTKPFWEAARQGRLIVQKCDACGKAVFYPRAICPHCWSDGLRWHNTNGRGRLKSYSLVHRPGHPAWTAVAPYMIGLVELEEGPTMLSNILASTAHVVVGMWLVVEMTKVGTEILPFFKPVNHNLKDLS